MNNLYIEISPRGAGKTWRMVEAIKRSLEKNPYKKIAVITPSTRGGEYIRNDKRLDGFKRRVELFDSDPPETFLSFYDDFIINKNLIDVNLEGYYCSSVSDQMNINFLQNNKDSFFAKLLRAADYKYVTCFPFDFYPAVFDAKIRKTPAFKSEILNQIFTLG
jgi:hypothetical protein